MISGVEVAAEAFLVDPREGRRGPADRIEVRILTALVSTLHAT
jgi:hypothetical protein